MTDETPIVVSIKGDVSGGKVVVRTLDDIADAEEKTVRGTKQLQQELKTTDTVSRQLSGAMRALAAAFGLRELQQTVDAYTNVQNRLKLVTNGTSELTAVTQQLFEISNRTRQAFGDTAEVYSRVALAVKDMGLTSQQTLQFTESLNQAVTLSGASAVEASAGLIQLSQGLASGTLRGDELRSVLEQLPAVADVIANGLSVTRGELLKMGEQGEITAGMVIKAFAEARVELDNKFAKTVPTIGQSFVVLKNNITQFIGELDKATGASGEIAKIILSLGKNIETLTKLILLAAAAWGAYQVAAYGAFGASVLTMIVGNITAFVQLAATVRTASQAVALLNATFLIGPGALVAAIAAVVAGAALFHTQIENMMMKPLVELIILVDKAASGISRLFGGSGGNLSGMSADQLRAAASTAIGERTPKQIYDEQQAQFESAMSSKIPVTSGGGGNGKISKTQKDLNSVIKETATEQEKLLDKIKELEKLKGFAKTSEEVEAINRGLAVANQELLTASTLVPGLEDNFSRLARVTDSFGDSISGAFGSFIDGSKSARGALSDLIGDLRKTLTSEFITNPLSNVLKGLMNGAASGGGSGGGLFSSIGSGISKLFGFDSGGSMVIGGRSGIDQNTLSLNGSPIASVGRGEVLSISPNQSGGGSGVTVYQTIQISTGVQETVAAEFLSMMPKIQEATKAAIQDERVRGIS